MDRPTSTKKRKLSGAEVEILIRDPAAAGLAFVGLAGSDTILTFNFDTQLVDNTALINILFSKGDKNLNEIHNEYQIISENVADDIPSQS